MIDLTIFFKIIFDTIRISYGKLRNFSEDHVNRLAANNPGGIYNAILTDISSAYTNYFGALSDEATKKAVKEGATVIMNLAFDNFIAWVRQQHGTILGTFGENSSQMQEFYPQGLNEYNKATLKNAPVLMTRYLNAATTHAASLPPNFLPDITAIITTFTTARTLQLTLKGEVETERDEKIGTRNVVEIQLMKNLLFIAFNNVGNPDAMDTYFEQSIIRPRKKRVYKDPLAPGETKKILTEDFEANDEIKISNPGTTDIMFCLAPDENTACSTGVTLMPGEEKTVKASELGDVNVNHSFNVTNLNAGTAGEYRAEV